MTNGLPIDLTAVLQVAHTFDVANTASNGGQPALDQVSLWVHNSDPTNEAVVVITFDPPSGSSVVLTVTVPANTTAQVIEETVFGGTQSASIGGAGTLGVNLSAGEGQSDDAQAWGWFVRTQG